MRPRIGSLFSGGGGLDLAVEQVTGGEVVWHSEVDPHASTVLAHHWPGVPNLGDITAIDWAEVPPVDVLCGGFPCQPVSLAGARKGTHDERWLFDDILTAIRTLDPPPRLCVFENVRGLLSANGGDAMARVVEGLAGVGYVGSYGILPASAVGAAHQRERVFIVAYPADTDRDVLRELTRAAFVEETGPDQGHGLTDSGGGSRHVTYLPTPVADNSRGLPSKGTAYQSLANAVALLPTPVTTDAAVAAPADLNRNSPGLRALPAMLPTPQASNQENRQTEGYGPTLGAVVRTNFGEYAPAIERAARAIGRPAPPPTEPNTTTGNPRLASRFVEWLMMWPDGHVTAAGLPRTAELRILGNGVVPAQAATAIRLLLERAS